MGKPIPPTKHSGTHRGASATDRSAPPPKHTPPEEKPDGFCDPNDIRSSVRARGSVFRACYEGRLQVKPEIHGRMIVRFVIDKDGRVSQAAIAENNIDDGAVGECVLRVVRRITFAKPTGGVCIVHWPFVFEPSCDSIAKVQIRRNASRFRNCYEHRPEEQNNLHGTVVVRFTTGKDGKISRLAVTKNTLDDNGAVAKCVVGIMQELTFPELNDGICTVEETFLFLPTQ